MLPLSSPELVALVEGEAVAVFVPRGTLTEGDEVELDTTTADRSWIAVVTAVDPTALFDPAAASARHVLASVTEGDLVVLRVYDGDRPVLSDEAFHRRVRSIEGAMR